MWHDEQNSGVDVSSTEAYMAAMPLKKINTEATVNTAGFFL